MDIELLRTFLELNRTRHFGMAAEALCVTQAAVSARLKQLESILGIQLFVRNRREVKLTPEGHRLKRHAERMIADWRKARQEVTAGGARHQLSVSSSPRLWDILLQRWLIDLRRMEPELAITTYSSGPDAMMRQLLDGVVDLAFMLDPPVVEDFQVHELAPLRLTLVSSQPGLDIEQATGSGFVMIDWGLAHALELHRAFPDMPEPFTRLATARLAFEYLRNVGGSAYLPLAMVNSALRRKNLYRVQAAPVFERQAHAVYPVRSNRIALVSQVLSIFPRSTSTTPVPG
jgi:DNA-binding transcriptional LysR family regulator